MIKLRESSIADIMPHTTKTREKLALSCALSSVFKSVYDSLSDVAIWQDLDDVDPKFYEIIAAELACPFYQLAQTDEERLAAIKAAYEYNRKVGTVGAVQEMIEAVLGGGQISEWFDYGGDPYCFRIELGEWSAGQEEYKLFDKYINTVKNKRSKLDAITKSNRFNENIYFAMSTVDYQEITIPADEPFGRLDRDRLDSFVLG